MNTKEVVNSLLEFTRGRLLTVGVTAPSEELVLLTAKELNLVVGKRGRDGGTFATDSGLTTLGLNVAEFRAAELTERELVKAQRVKAPKTTDMVTNEE